ncbi:MAG: hypothetical protein LUC41_05545, partial [Clostridiales bacterium]|nr:hypothetical protein [Clostridiales bacterium]
NNDGNDDGNDEDEPEEEPDEPEEDEETDISERYYSLNGAVLYPSATLPSDVSEEGFEQDEVMLWNEDYECLVDTFSGGEYILLWLEDEDGEDGQLALVLSDDLYEAYSYVCLRAENTFVIVLPSVAAPTEIMDGYSWGTRSIEGKGMVDALFLDGDSGSDFALVYCASSQGVAGWYRLDTSDLTFIRYVRDAAQEEDEPEEISTEAETETEEVSSEEEEKSGGRGHLVIGIIAIAVLVVVIVIILIFILRGRGIGGGDEDDDDDDIEFLDV